MAATTVRAKNTQHFGHPSCYPFMEAATTFPSYLTPEKHKSVLPFYIFAIFRLLYKWNQTVCYLLGLAFFPVVACIKRFL